MMTTTGKQFTLTDKDSPNVCFNHTQVNHGSGSTPHRGHKETDYSLVEEREKHQQMTMDPKWR